MFERSKRPFYVGRNGNVFCVEDIANAFHVMEGKTRYEDEGAYIRFLDGLFHDGTLTHVTFPSAEQLLIMGKKVMATKAYRSAHDCTLSEAYAAVTAYERAKEEAS